VWTVCGMGYAGAQRMGPYSLDLRRRIVDAYRAGEGTVNELADRFAVHRNSVLNYLARFRKTGDVVPRAHGGGVAPRIADEELGNVLEVMGEKDDRTWAEGARRYRERYGVEVSRSTFGRALHRSGMSRKKKTLIALEQRTERVQRARRRFVRRAHAQPARRFVFLDEFGARIDATRPWAWSYRGRRVHGYVPARVGANVTLIAGLSLRGVHAPCAFQGALNTDIFEAYVRDQLAAELRPGDIVVVDGLSAHRGREARRAIQARGARLWFLPPYSPDLSPVEECGAKVKDRIRGHDPRSVRELYDAMGDALAAVTTQDARA